MVLSQALSISRSLTEAKVAAVSGEVNCRKLRNSVIQAVQEAGGVIDYAEVSMNFFLFSCMVVCSVAGVFNVWFSQEAELMYFHFFAEQYLFFFKRFLGLL